MVARTRLQCLTAAADDLEAALTVASASGTSDVDKHHLGVEKGRLRVERARAWIALAEEIRKGSIPPPAGLR